MEIIVKNKIEDFKAIIVNSGRLKTVVMGFFGTASHIRWFREEDDLRIGMVECLICSDTGESGIDSPPSRCRRCDGSGRGYHDEEFIISKQAWRDAQIPKGFSGTVEYSVDLDLDGDEAKRLFPESRIVQDLSDLAYGSVEICPSTCSCKCTGVDMNIVNADEAQIQIIKEQAKPSCKTCLGSGFAIRVDILQPCHFCNGRDNPCLQCSGRGLLLLRRSCNKNF